METNEVIKYRAYSGPCKGCNAPEMVKCSSDCTYVDEWQDYYIGPSKAERSKARAARIADTGVIRGVQLSNS